MTLAEALERARRLFQEKNIPEALLESQVILGHALGQSRTWLLAHPEEELPPQAEEKFWEFHRRRLEGEPTAYILGKEEFYGRDFYVDPRALIPRPESELLVERALSLAGAWQGEVLLAEVGTGSGALAITLALELPRARVFALDVSPGALEVARINRERYALEGRVELLLGDMLSPLPCPVHLILGNLPYIPETERDRLPPEVARYEPALALFGGEDGLDPLRALLPQVGPRLQPGGSLLLEIGQGQAQKATQIVVATFPEARLQVFPDLAGIPRVIEVTPL